MRNAPCARDHAAEQSAARRTACRICGVRRKPTSGTVFSVTWTGFLDDSSGRAACETPGRAPVGLRPAPFARAFGMNDSSCWRDPISLMCTYHGCGGCQSVLWLVDVMSWGVSTPTLVPGTARLGALVPTLHCYTCGA